MEPQDVVAAFVERINAHDVAGLSDLMTDDHTFVDALDSRVSGREAMRSAWERYFALVRDYWMTVETTLHKEGTVALFGTAGGTYLPPGEGSSPRWEVPAAWLARVRDGRVALWRVYADNLPLRRLMRHE